MSEQNVAGAETWEHGVEMFCEIHDKSAETLIEFVLKLFWRWYEKITRINRIYDSTQPIS